MRNILKLIFLFGILTINLIINIIFTSNVPMRVTNGDILYSLVFSLIILAIVFWISKSKLNNSFVKIIIYIFLVFWMLNLINLVEMPGEKSYILNIIQITTCVISLLIVRVKKERE